jgi:hypothetical protein
MKYFIIAATLLLTSAGIAADTDNPDPAIDEAVYVINRYIVTRADTKNLIAAMKFMPTKGWKWNTKYPTSFTIKEGKTGKVPYHLIGEHIELVDGEPAHVWLELKPSVYAKVVRQRFTVTAVYSFCNKTVCQTFKRDVDF